MQSDTQTEKLIEKLSPLEKMIIPHLNLPLRQIKEKTNLDDVSILRALKFLQNKKFLTITAKKKKIIELGTNGIYYKKARLPERKLLEIIEQNNHIPLEEAKKNSKLSDNEFKVSLGVLKDKAFIEIRNGKISLTATKEELSKKSLEEQFIDAIPLEESSLTPEQLHALKNLQKRKDIVQIKEEISTSFVLTELGKQFAGKEIKLNLIEEITPEVIKTWNKNKKFRSYDIRSEVPRIFGGKNHFVNQAIEYGRKIWLEMGFSEMNGKITTTSLWNFDALFTPQDHPARELHDTFFISNTEGKLPDKKIVSEIKKSHETGVAQSRGWNYKWSEDEAEKVVLRTHTTCLSAQTLSKLKKENIPSKFFAFGKCFRNETVDPTHGFEFNQTEGIVVDENANFSHLLGYLNEFAKKMGFKKVRFRPHYFPYTEPSLEGDVWDEENKKWVEVFAAGIFRPEVTEPLFGKPIPVLAWGPGFDRMIMKIFQISDMRDMYKNDIGQLRKIKFLVK